LPLITYKVPLSYNLRRLFPLDSQN
jgi:hypothetical protein